MGAWNIIAKDLRLLSRDRRALSTLLALPMIFIAIIGMTTGQLLGWQSSNQVLKIGIVDNANNNPLVQKIVQRLEKKGSVETMLLADRPDAEMALDSRKCITAVLIGRKFGENVEGLSLKDALNTKQGALSAGMTALDMEVLNRDAFAGAGGIVSELVWSATLRVVVPHVVRHSPAARPLLRAAGIDPETAEDEEIVPAAQGGAAQGGTASEGTLATSSTGKSSNSKGTSDPKPVVDSGSPNGPRVRTVYNALVPAYTVMFVFFMVNIMARSFLAERDTGTLRRLRISPLGPTSILFGKTVPFYIISLAQSATLFVCGKLLFQMSWGTAPWLLIPVILCTSLAATTLGLLVATLVRSDSQVSAYATSLVIIMAGISGCFMPREWLPDIMLKISLITPHAWSLMAYEQLLVRQHIEMNVVRECCLMLLTYSAIYFLLGRLRFKTLN